VLRSDVGVHIDIYIYIYDDICLVWYQKL